MPRTSAGLLMFRRSGDTLEVLLAHPGGPFFRNKDDGVWTIPKGEAEPGANGVRRRGGNSCERRLDRSRMGKAERRQNGLRLGLRGKFARQFPGLLEQFRNGVA